MVPEEDMRNNIEAMNVRERNEGCVCEGVSPRHPLKLSSLTGGDSTQPRLRGLAHTSWMGAGLLSNLLSASLAFCGNISQALKRLLKAQKDQALLEDELKWLTFKIGQAGTEMQRLWKAQLSHLGAVSFPLASCCCRGSCAGLSSPGHFCTME